MNKNDSVLLNLVKRGLLKFDSSALPKSVIGKDVILPDSWQQRYVNKVVEGN